MTFLTWRVGPKVQGLCFRVSGLGPTGYVYFRGLHHYFCTVLGSRYQDYSTIYLITLLYLLRPFPCAP